MRFASTRMLLVAATVACTGSDVRVHKENAASVPPPQAQSTTAAGPAEDDYTIWSSGIGPIRIGMTLDDARRVLPTATFKRSSDGDGAALVEVTLAPDTTMILWAEEEDAEAPIDWSRRITQIESFSAAFHASAGIHPGSLVTEVERVYGKTTEITLSEIESRQYIRFEAQPPELTFRLDYTGKFQSDARTTTELEPEAKILSIAVSSPRS